MPRIIGCTLNCVKPARRQARLGPTPDGHSPLADLGVAAIIDEETGARPPGLPLSPGTYLALAALNRVVDPCSKRGFADWWW